MKVRNTISVVLFVGAMLLGFRTSLALELPANPPVTDDLLVWLDGGSAATSGSAVTSWGDMASYGGANNFLQAAGGNQPVLVPGALNGLPAIEFDGSNDYLQLTADAAMNTNTGKWTTFILFKPDVVSGGNRNILRTGYADIDPSATVRATTALWGSWNGGSPYAFNVHGRNVSASYVGVGDIDSSRVTTGWHLQSVTYNPLVDPSIVLRTDGVQAATTVNDLTTYASGHTITRIGAKSDPTPGEYFDGRMAELMIYKNTLTTAQVKSVEAYLGFKYGFLQAEGLDTGMTLYSPFDGAASIPQVLTPDVSGNGFVAISESAGVRDDPSRGKVIDYTGSTSDFTSLGNVLDPGTGNFSISFWMNANNAGAFDFITSHGNVGSTNAGWAVHLAGTTVNIRGDFNGDATDNRWSVLNGPLTLDTWQHFTMVIDRGDTTSPGSGIGGIVRGYVNGTQFGSAALNVTNSIDGAGMPMVFGRRGDMSTGFSYDGLLDDVYVYQGTALTPTQVSTLAGGGSVSGATAAYDFSATEPRVNFIGEASDTLGNHHGTIVGNVPATTTGEAMVGQGALNFPKSDAAHVTYGDVLDPGTGSYTVSLWFNADVNNITQFLAGKGNAGSGSVGWSIWASNNVLSIRADYVESDHNLQRLELTNTGGFTTGQWRHVVLVIDQEAGLLSAYLDGLGSGATGAENGWAIANGGVGRTNTFTGPVTFENADPLLLGRRSTTGAPYDGRLDEFSVWNRALGAEEVSTLYAAGLAGMAVPEPGGIALACLGALGLALAGLFRKK